MFKTDETEEPILLIEYQIIYQKMLVNNMRKKIKS